MFVALTDVFSKSHLFDSVCVLTLSLLRVALNCVIHSWISWRSSWHLEFASANVSVLSFSSVMFVLSSSVKLAVNRGCFALGTGVVDRLELFEPNLDTVGGGVLGDLPSGSLGVISPETLRSDDCTLTERPLLSLFKRLARILPPIVDMSNSIFGNRRYTGECLCMSPPICL